MPIQFACPKCKRPITVDDRYAGRSSRCPGCSAAIAVPAAADDDDNPFGFGDGPLVTSVGGKAVAASQPEDEAASAEVARLRQEPGWQTVNAGLKNVWLGTGLQVLGVTTVLLVLGIVVSTGATFMSRVTVAAEGGDPDMVGRAGSSRMGEYIVNGTVGVFVLAGTVLRLLGFVRCLAVPPPLGAKGIVAGMLLCELVPFAAISGSLLDLVEVLKPARVLPLLFSWTSFGIIAADLLIGVALLVVLMRRIGVRLGSKDLPRFVTRFVYWLIGGLLIAGMATCGFKFWMDSMAGQRVTSYLPFFALLGLILLDATIALILLIKYLGVLTLTTDELRKRTGKHWA